MNLPIAEQVMAEGRYYRRIIRRGKGTTITRAKAEILIAVFNLWLYHRNGPKGYIHPSRDSIARKVKCSTATVKRAFSDFRDAGFMVPLSDNLRAGRGTANCYKVDLSAIQNAFDPCNVVTIPGRLEPLNRIGNDPLNDPLSAGQNDPLSYDGTVVQFPIRMGGCK